MKFIFRFLFLVGIGPTTLSVIIYLTMLIMENTEGINQNDGYPFLFFLVFFMVLPFQLIVSIIVGSFVEHKRPMVIVNWTTLVAFITWLVLLLAAYLEPYY